MKQKWNDFRENHDILLRASISQPSWFSSSSSNSSNSTSNESHRASRVHFLWAKRNNTVETNKQAIGEERMKIRDALVTLWSVGWSMGIASITVALRTYSSHFVRAVQQTTTDESGNSEMCFSFSSILAVSPKVISFGRRKNYHFAHIDIGVTIFKWNASRVWQWWIKGIINSQDTFTSSVAHTHSWANLLRLFRWLSSESRRKTIILRHLTFGISFLFRAHSHTATAGTNYLSSLRCAHVITHKTISIRPTIRG